MSTRASPSNTAPFPVGPARGWSRRRTRAICASPCLEGGVHSHTCKSGLPPVSTYAPHRMHTRTQEGAHRGRHTSAAQRSWPRRGAASMTSACSADLPGQSAFVATPSFDFTAQHLLHLLTPRKSAHECVAARARAARAFNAGAGRFAHPSLATFCNRCRRPPGGCTAGQSGPAAAISRAVANASCHCCTMLMLATGEGAGCRESADFAT